MINPLYCFFGSEGHVALDRNLGPVYDTLLLRLIPGDLLRACPHRQFHTLPGLLDSRAALSNSYPNALRAMQGGSLYHFYDGFWYNPTGTRHREQKKALVNPKLPLIPYVFKSLDFLTYGCIDFSSGKRVLPINQSESLVFIKQSHVLKKLLGLRTVNIKNSASVEKTSTTVNMNMNKSF